jgi:signal transduction histidine kinase/ligand-binding sensor domain-containing protein
MSKGSWVKKYQARRNYMALAKRLVALAICIFAAGATVCVLAQNNDEQIDGFTRTVFSERDGAFGQISNMAQTPDGWMWFVEQNHLYRFDGITPELVDVPSLGAASVSAIFAAKSGDLWLADKSGRTIVLPAGDFHHPRTVRNNDAVMVISFAQDKHGDIWSFAPNAIYKAAGDEWHRVGKESGLDAERFYALHMDTDGTLWVLSNKGVFTLADGHTQFEQYKFNAPWLTPHLNDVQGSLMLFGYGDAYLSIIVAVSGKKEVPTYSESFFRAITDTRGGFWVMGPVVGIRRAASPDPQALVALGESLSNAASVDPAVWVRMSSSDGGAGFEDRQHNIWVKTRTGLELFRPSVATPLKLPSGDYGYAMLPDHDGSIWFGTAQSVHAFRWWHVASSITPAEGYDLDTTAVYRDTDDSVLLGTGEGLLRRFADGKFEPISPLPPGGDREDDVIAIARDGQNKLWVSLIRHPIAQLDDGHWIVKGGFDQLPDSGNRRAITDAHGRLWLGYPHDVFVIDGKHLTRYSRDTGMDITSVGDIIPDGIPLVGGADGLAAFDGRRFHRILALDPSVLTNINGMVRLKDGTVWLYGQKGAVRINAGEIERALKDPSYEIALRLFDDDNGMPGAAQNNHPNPSLVEGTDGRLWFGGYRGLAWIDPAKIWPSQDPTVVIRSMTVGDKSYRSDSLPAFPPGTRNIQIDYTAIGLSDATKPRFRYKLTGIDKNWQDVGSRRQAFYNSLSPGTYEFRVAVTNEDNTWARATADIHFVIEPTFYQTVWFLILCIALILALLWVAYLYHLHQVTQRLRQRLEERHAERDRIARELHDTYLQTVHGLVLKVGAVSHELPEGGTKNKILGTLNHARVALAEGRNRVYALRAETADNMDLVAAFQAVAQEYDGDPSPLFDVTSTGAIKAADPLVIDELYASGREAIVNAFNHASAKAVRVDICYDKKGIRVEITDDGKGIDLQVIQDGGIPGHWGLRGIRERMERIGGEPHITSEGANGTKVILFVAARRAYIHR